MRRLAAHPGVEICAVTSRSNSGTAVADYFPSLRGVYDLKFQTPDEAGLAQCNVVFFATPNGVAMKEAPLRCWHKACAWWICRPTTESNAWVVLSVIDNLVKGAAGQAVQNMNIMFGFNKTACATKRPARRAAAALARHNARRRAHTAACGRVSETARIHYNRPVFTLITFRNRI